MQVNVGNVGELHLETLRRVGSMDAARKRRTDACPRDRQTEALPDEEENEPAMVEREYEEIDEDEAERAAKREKL